MTKNFYITTPIYYVNDSPHIGHAYTTIACDVIARFMKLDGYDVKFLTGTDEHGQKVEQSAKKAGLDPQSFTDQVSQKFRDLADDLNCCHNDFIRTTENRHKKAAQELWKRLEEKGQIYLDHYAGWYAVRDEAFYAESELVNGKAPTGADVEWVEEPSYFFKLSEWQEPLLKFYEENPDFIAPISRRNEVISFVKGGLKDLSVSRTTFKWGVPVPNNPDHIMYVWLDALTNYMTAVSFPDENAEEYKKYWPADIHVVGKDILRFHAIYWPAFLLAAGLTPPKKIYAHGWWTNEGQKISKSLGNVINPYSLIEEYGLDQTRYFMVREVPFGNDGNFSHTSMINRVNSELANDLGNLAQRSLSMVFKNCDGKIPAPGKFQKEDLALLTSAKEILPKLRTFMAKDQALHKYCETIWSVVGAANKYVDDQAPWGLKKTDPKRMETVLYTLAETIRILGLYVQPIMPNSSGKLLDQLKVLEENRTFISLENSLTGNTPIDKPEPIFPRYVKEEK
jgi:methionyl-tRNA synthetase